MNINFRLNSKSGKLISLIVFILMLVGVYFLLAYVPEGNYLPPVDNGYEVTNYSVNIIVKENRSVDIEEDITVNFLEASHGIYRYIPYSSTQKYEDKNGNIQSKSLQYSITDFTVHGADELVLTEMENGCKIYQIGDPDHKFTGLHTYNLSYTMWLGNDKDEIEDVFYHNIIGAGVNTTIDNVSFTIKFPTNIESENFKFYVGEYGDDFSGHDSRLNFDVLNDTITGSCISLQPWEAITVFNLFDEGYFIYEYNYTFDIFILVATIVVFLSILLLFIFKRRKDPVVDVVEFKAPEGMTPTEVGYINDGELTGDDLSALIVYWANKGYVKISNEDSKNMTITKIQDLPQGAKEHEKILFKAFFEEGDEINSSSMGGNIGYAGYKSKNSAIKDCAKYFDKKPANVFNCISILTVALLILPFLRMLFIDAMPLAGFFGGIGLLTILGFSIINIDDVGRLKYKISSKKYTILIILLIIGIIGPFVGMLFILDPYLDLWGARFYLYVLPLMLLLICPFLENYTQKGREVLGHIRGLKSYILHAEKAMLEMLVHDNPSTFYEVLPYAYVLGVSKVYMDKFKDINVEQPDWFDGDFDRALFLINLHNNMNYISSQSFGHNMHTPSSGNGGLFGGSGGFGGGSGGGFSGGGSGGGGMGRW